MAMIDRFKKAWNAFRNTNELDATYSSATAASGAWYGSGSPSRTPRAIYNERSIISAIYTRLSIDVAGLVIKHIKVDDQDRYKEDMSSTLNDCLLWEPNIDQSPRPFRQDIVMTMFDRGVAVVVPVDTSKNPQKDGSYDIYSLRVGEVVTWYPKHIKLSLYNEVKGKREDVTLEKDFVAVIENPLYAVMNEPNSTLQRLIRKLSLLDAIDEQSGSGKLDLIIQLPYVIKSEARRQQAEKRREDIEFQLKGSQYGIAYTDGTEKITQLNRPAENNLLNQVEYLSTMLFNQLGLTEEVMNGTATEEIMLNYFNRTVEPIVDAIVESMQRAFLGPQGAQSSERIRYFRDPFKLVPTKDIAEIADKFTRNEILTSNEIRMFMGIKPSEDPKADELTNANMPQPNPTQTDNNSQPPLPITNGNGSKPTANVGA